METSKPSKAAFWSGWILSGLTIIFLLVDAGMKIARAQVSVDGSIQLGWPDAAIVPIGIVLLVSTVLYAIPRTAILGAILLTGYLGGAVAVMVEASVPGHPYLFPIIFGIVAWSGLGLRDAKAKGIFF